MLSTAEQAVKAGVCLGAHPSYDDRPGFGRVDMEVAPELLLAQLAYQIGAMTEMARQAGGRVRFVKPHGALYNRAAADPAVAEVVVEAVRNASRPDQPMLLLAPWGSQMWRRAGETGVPTAAEAFADRGYRSDGSLAPRTQPGALIEDPDRVAAQAVSLARHGRVETIDGKTIEVRSDSLCVHGDTPGAAQSARLLKRALENAGIDIAPFAGDIARR